MGLTIIKPGKLKFILYKDGKKLSSYEIKIEIHTEPHSKLDQL